MKKKKDTRLEYIQSMKGKVEAIECEERRREYSWRKHGRQKEEQGKCDFRRLQDELAESDRMKVLLYLFAPDMRCPVCGVVFLDLKQWREVPTDKPLMSANKKSKRFIPMGLVCRRCEKVRKNVINSAEHIVQAEAMCEYMVDGWKAGQDRERRGISVLQLSRDSEVDMNKIRRMEMSTHYRLTADEYLRLKEFIDVLVVEQVSTYKISRSLLIKFRMDNKISIRTFAEWCDWSVAVQRRIERKDVIVDEGTAEKISSAILRLNAVDEMEKGRKYWEENFIERRDDAVIELFSEDDRNVPKDTL